MEKLYKYNSGKKLQELFKEYDRDNYSIKGYVFISQYLKEHSIKNFDVIQICEMFTEMEAVELFGVIPESYKQKKELKKALKIKEKNIHFYLIDNGLYMVWHTEHIAEMYEMNNME